jgi:hypothetical protein
MRLAAALALLLTAAPAAAQSTSSYYVYCANNRIEVDSRDPDQMRIARGSGVCMLGRFGFRMDAESFARNNFGGPGGRCSCR